MATIGQLLSCGIFGHKWGSEYKVNGAWYKKCSRCNQTTRVR